MDNRIFRKLTPADLPAVTAMNGTFREGFADAVSAAQFLENPKNWLFACLADGVIVGFAYGYELERLDGAGNMMYIHEVGVLPSFQRRGIGETLLRSLKDECRSAGLNKIFLITDQGNVAANALYQKVGGEKSLDSGGKDVCWFFPLGEGSVPERR